MSKMTKNKLALLALAGLGAVASGPTLAGGMTVDSKGGLEVFELDDPNYWFKVGGRLFVDQAFFDGNESDSGFPSGSQIRSARVTLKGGVGAGWIYKMDLDFQDLASFNGATFAWQGSGGRSRFGEVFLGYAGCKDWWAALGQVSVPFGLEGWANPSDLSFMELALPSDAFSHDYVIGLYGEWHGSMFTAAGTVYHPGAGSTQGLGATDTAPATMPGSDPLGAGARITFSPVHNDHTVYHAGISARYENEHDTQNQFNYIAGLEVHTRQTPVLFTNIPANSVKSHHVWGFELAGRWGPFILQGEYMLAGVNRDASFPADDPRLPGGNLDYHGYYVAATYVLTGETKEYDFETGTFGRVHPNSRKGAWEIGVRHSYINLIDNQTLAVSDTPYGGTVYQPVRSPLDMAGGAHSTTIGLTWWLNDNVRFLANYVRMDLPASRNIDVLGLRAQVNF